MGEYVTRVLPGFMELLPEEQLEFDRIRDTIADTYAAFGFTALDTPVIERRSILLAKAGGETLKQIYSVENTPGGYDLTVPLARYMAEHMNDLSFPFRRCHIAKVYRGERPQKGRYREFYQCDIDVIGRESLSLRYDAEIPYIIYTLFRRLDFGKFTIRINNRKLLSGFLSSLPSARDGAELLRAVDKVEKLRPEEFRSLLLSQGLTEADAEALREFITVSGAPGAVLEKLRGMRVPGEAFADGLAELEQVSAAIADLGVDPAYFTIDLSIARGLDYYTGTVYETILDDYPRLGSVCSGGRYENLASCYTNQKLPGVGISIGLTRLFYQLREQGLLRCSRKTAADAVVVPMEAENLKTAAAAADALRAAGLRADLLLEDMSMKKKFQYVARKDAPFTVVIGSDEEAAGSAALQYKDAEGQVVKTRVPMAELAGRVLALRDGRA